MSPAVEWESGSIHSGEIAVLTVSHESESADSVAKHLQREDDRIAVTTAASVSEGLDALEESQIDCIISDYDMPRQNGIDFLETVREEDTDLPFILYTGNGSEAVASKAISTGVTDYLQKGSGSSHYTVLANRIINVVEQYRSRQAIHEIEQKLSEIADRTNDVLFMFNEDWSELLFINSAYEDVWGGSIADLKSNPQSFLDLIHPEDRETARKSMNRLLNGNADAIEYRIQPPDSDGVRYINAETKPITDDEGNVERIVGFTRDITEQKEREATVTALHEAALQFGKAQTKTEVYQILVDNAQEILDFSNVAVSSRENEALVHKAQTLTEKDEGDAARTPLTADTVSTRAYKSGETIVADDPEDCDIAIADAESVSVLVVPIGEIGTFQTVKRDGGGFDELDRELAELLVSHALEALKRLDHASSLEQQRKQLQRENERLETIVGIISHDVRNPLNVAKGNLELAMENAEIDYLDPAVNALERMDELIENVLIWAREGAQVADAETSHVDLETLGEACWQTVETGGAALNVGETPEIAADERRLQQVFENLYRNAVEHGDRDVEIRVGALENGFYIEDDGPGIPPDERQKVFEHGYSTGEGGTGFGLNIVEEIVDAHGWEISVTEGADGGARFEIVDVEFAADE